MERLTSCRKRLCVLVAALLIFIKGAPDACNAAVFRQGASEDMRIALTFDDGPHPKYTAQILDLLDEYGIRATFFVIGMNARAHPELVARELEEGHEVGNHTFSHKILPEADESTLIAEISACQDLLLQNGSCGYLFRPPQGRYDKNNIDTLTRLGYSVVLWSVDTKDWSGVEAERIVSELRKSTKGGSIILCHDFITSDCHTLEALRIAIPELLARGFEFVTVSELLYS